MRPLSRKEKQAAILTVVVMLGIGGFCYFQADDMEVAEPAMQPAKQQANAAAAPTNKQNLGIETAQGEVRNPFDSSHATRSEEEKAMPKPVEPAMPLATDTITAEPGQILPTAPIVPENQDEIPAETQATEREQPVLCGIVTGSQGDLAIVRWKSKTQSVAVGEWIGPFAVCAILADRICLQADDEQHWLRLNQF